MLIRHFQSGKDEILCQLYGSFACITGKGIRSCGRAAML